VFISFFFALIVRLKDLKLSRITDKLAITVTGKVSLEFDFSSSSLL